MGITFVLLTAAWFGPAAWEKPGQGDAETIVIAAPESAEVGYFVHEREVKSGFFEPVATSRFVRWPLESGGWHLELETRFLKADLHVSHVERLEPGRRTLNWRERRGRTGRSLFLQGSNELRGWIANGGRTHRIDVPSSTRLPLEWLGSALDGEVRPGALQVFDPLRLASRTVEVVDREGEARQAWAWKEGGIDRERFQIDDQGLRGFGWRSDSLLARRISRARFDQYHGRAPAPRSAPASKDPSKPPIPAR